METVIKVLIADDYRIDQLNAYTTLQQVIGVEIVGFVQSKSDVYTVYESLQPDVLVLGLSISVMLWRESVLTLQRNAPRTRLLLIIDDEMRREALAMPMLQGIGCIRRSEVPSLLIPSVFMVAAGYIWQDTDKSRSKKNTIAVHQYGFPTSREIDVLYGLAHGLTNARIAYELGITERTVRAHVESLFERLEIDNRKSAVIKALQIGWIDIADC
ncbi:MAG: hypothetical protein GFH27_549285n304 [Chloroflexi bacterium AL-W]|nr:hypothetical protein [Chloroflexi bacterium AL-N1]NOK65816.1 hypothetical protein [Chloroflexi bacterium AL-N10]NOK74243.1 hypothetical protein [Chloroflexi bacterium AL-N5]NOK80849.1 hypothetical protein [Chloroflexi bacterium AL-W]NOK88501.1 hypothetical protein [Chloroflexi bacterium AL-N15]